MLQDIRNALELNLITNEGVANSLLKKIEAAEKVTGAARSNILSAFENEVNVQSNKHITGIAPRVLTEDAECLIRQNAK